MVEAIGAKAKIRKRLDELNWLHDFLRLHLLRFASFGFMLDLDLFFLNCWMAVLWLVGEISFLIDVLFLYVSRIKICERIRSTKEMFILVHGSERC